MKKLLIPFGIIGVLLIFLSFGIFWWWQNSKPVSTSEETARFVIPKGRNATQIGEELYKKGLIKTPLVFKFYVQLTGKSKELQAGEFKVSPSYTLIQVVDALTSGPLELWVSIPEGLRREEVVERFIKDLEMDSTQASLFREEFLKASEEKEGFLFPDTYLFPRDVTGVSAVALLTKTFENKLTQEVKDAIGKSEYKLNKIVLLASIIERETKTDGERPIVAGILFKRLEAGWPLQVDATLQYAIANAKCQMLNAKCENWWPILTRQDLEIKSPYNTYKYIGLPPAPIANPGLSSISAAAMPKESPYWYYIHDPDGIIHFARDLTEHNENIRKYLRK